MVVEEAALGRPVFSVLVDNGSLVSCCGGLQRSAASLSTLHSTSFPTLNLTCAGHTHKAFFSSAEPAAAFLFEGEAHRLDPQMESCFVNSLKLLADP